MPTCFICHKIYPDIASIWIHFKLVHFLFAGSQFRCGEPKCSRSFGSIKSYRRHWCLEHTEQVVRPQDAHNNFTTDCHIQGSSNVQDSISISVNQNLHNTSDIHMHPSREAKGSPSGYLSLENVIQRHALQMIAKLYNYPTFPRSHVQFVVEAIQSFLSEGLGVVHKNVEARLQELDETPENLNETSNIFSSLKNAFHGLETEHQRFKKLRDTGHLIAPIEVVIGQRFEKVTSTSDGHTQMAPVGVRAHFIPLRDVLKKVFEMSNVYRAVTAYVEKLEAENDVISNFIQGSLWKNKVHCYAEKQVLPLFLFFDDYETGNALGSHAGIHKLGAVYISIPCYPPEFQSVLTSIYPALLFFTDDRKEFGNASIFQKLIAELEYLQEEDILIEHSEGTTRLYFKLGLIVGDNLGLHSILGFIENFSGNYCCRFCKMHKQERAHCYTEDESLLRNVLTYNDDLLLGDCSLTGIKKKCVFHTLPGFHVTDNFAVDIMHDLFEGVCGMDMVEIIKYFTEEVCIFTLEDLNHRISCHDYGPVDSSNIPPQIPAHHIKRNHISMSAAEMLTFVTHFGVMVGDLVPEGNRVWQFYSILRQLIALLMCKSVQKDCYILLQTLIAEHNRSFVQLFKKNLKPKAHHLVHYPSIMKACGPLIHLWSMRFESKHRDSKLTAGVSTSRKNISTTLAIKGQLKLAYQFISNTGFTESLLTGPGYSGSLNDLPITINEEVPPCLESSAYIVNWVQKCGTKYKPGMIIAIADDDGLPCFGLIKYILIDQESKNVSFIFQELFVQTFHLHFQAYEIVFTRSYRLIQFDQLLNPMPITLVKEHGTNFVIVRHLL